MPSLGAAENKTTLIAPYVRLPIVPITHTTLELTRDNGWQGRNLNCDWRSSTMSGHCLCTSRLTDRIPVATVSQAPCFSPAVVDGSRGDDGIDADSQQSSTIRPDKKGAVGTGRTPNVPSSQTLRLGLLALAEHAHAVAFQTQWNHQVQ